MVDEHDSFFTTAIIEDVDKELDIHLISNNPSSVTEKNTPQLIGTKIATPIKSKSTRKDSLETTANISKLEDFINEKYNQLALINMKKDIKNELKQEFFKQLLSDQNAKVSENLTEQINLMQSKIYFLREQLKEQNNLLKLF